MLMIGLGGGSIAKFVHRFLAPAHMTAVEVNATVVALARSMFFLPPDDARLTTVVADGAAFVAQSDTRYDVLLVDGYVGKSPPEALVSEAFFAACRTRLTADGVLVANLWATDRRFDAFLRRIEDAFGELTLCLPTEKHSNVIVFAFRESPGALVWGDLKILAKDLERRFNLDFPGFVEGLKGMNPHTDKLLPI